ncbi:MAG: hypothetical protein ACRDMV_14430 [Streptosporangiales bacterium]
MPREAPYLGKHAAPKKRDARRPKPPSTRPVVPLLALALTCLSTAGAAVTATSQAGAQHAHAASSAHP